MSSRLAFVSITIWHILIIAADEFRFQGLECRLLLGVMPLLGLISSIEPMRGKPQEVVRIEAVNLMQKDVETGMVVSNMSCESGPKFTYEASFSSVSQIRV